MHETHGGAMRIAPQSGVAFRLRMSEVLPITDPCGETVHRQVRHLLAVHVAALVADALAAAAAAAAAVGALAAGQFHDLLDAVVFGVVDRDRNGTTFSASFRRSLCVSTTKTWLAPLIIEEQAAIKPTGPAP